MVTGVIPEGKMSSREEVQCRLIRGPKKILPHQCFYIVCNLQSLDKGWNGVAKGSIDVGTNLASIHLGNLLYKTG